MAAYLVTVDGLRGPEAQIWYDDSGQFVGPSSAMAKMKLPERDSWSIAEALNWARQNPDGEK